MALTFPRDTFFELFLNGSWNNIMTSVRQTTPINITRGRAGEQGEVAPAKLTCKLDNTNNQYTPSNPLGTWHGKIGRGTPMRFGFNVAKDTFTRTSVDSWGNATTGEVWTNTGAGGTVATSDFQVAGGVGTHSVPTTTAYRRSILDVNYLNVEVACTTTVPIQNITGGPIEPGNVFVRQSGTTYYFTRVSIENVSEQLTIAIYHTTGGVDTLLSGPVTVSGLVDAVSNKNIRVKMQAEGQTLRAKVYTPGAEPAGWHTAAKDTRITTAGAVGIRNGVAALNSNTKPIVFSNDDFEVRQLRFAGEIAEFKPRWNTAHTDKWVDLVGSSVLRRIKQGQTPLKSTLRRGLLADDVDLPIQYWPCEEGEDARTIRSAIDNNHMSIVSGRPQFNQFKDFVGSSPLAKMNGSIWSGSITRITSTGQAQLRFLFCVPSGGMPDNTVVCDFLTTGSIQVYRILYRTGGSLSLNLYNGSGTIIGAPGGAIGLDLNGQLVRVSLELAQSGGNVNWGLSRYDVTTGVVGGSSSSAAGTLGVPAQVIMNPAGGVTDTAVGHIVVQSLITSPTELSSEYGAWRGETPISRGERLCNENGLDFWSIGNSSAHPMGPQLPAPLPKLLQECQDTIQGTLYDSRWSGNTVVLRSINATAGQTSRATLDYAANQITPPFYPDADDKPVRNDVTVKRLAGGEFRVSQETGPLNAQDPGTDDDAVGRFDQQVPVNTKTELQLPSIGGWALHLGTTEAERWPSLRVNFRASGISATLHAQLLDLDLDDRITVTNLSENGFYDNVDLLVRGWTETYKDQFAHSIEFNCAPYEPYNVAEFGATDHRWDAHDADLTSTISSSATSFQIDTNKGQLWTTAAGSFPLDVMMGGERIRLSGISGTSSPQTATVATSGRAINGVVKGHTAGTKIKIWNPTYHAR